MLLLSADLLLPGPAGEVISEGAVLVDGTRIAAVGPLAELQRSGVPKDVVHRHFAGGTLLPGLINAHVHLVLDGSSDVVAGVLGADDDELSAQMITRAQAAVRSGCTTIRDLGDRGGLAVRLRDAIERGDVLGPRILAAGPPLTPPKGHCWFFGGEVDGIDEIRAQIRHTASLGVDLIKVMASGGQITPGSPPMWESQFTATELQVVVEEATRHGLPVAAHAHGTNAIAAAVRAGASTIEHCTWLAGPGREVRRDADVAAVMARHGIGACATVSRGWRGMIERFGEAADRIVGRLPWMAARGVPLLTGTDAGLHNSPFDDLPGALGLYTYLGFSTAEVLEMATTGTARQLGIGERTGQLRTEFDADILAVHGDPRDDLDALRDIQLVTTRGIVAI